MESVEYGVHRLREISVLYLGIWSLVAAWLLLTLAVAFWRRRE